MLIPLKEVPKAYATSIRAYLLKVQPAHPTAMGALPSACRTAAEPQTYSDHNALNHAQSFEAPTTIVLVIELTVLVPFPIRNVQPKTFTRLSK